MWQLCPFFIKEQAACLAAMAVAAQRDPVERVIIAAAIARDSTVKLKVRRLQVLRVAVGIGTLAPPTPLADCHGRDSALEQSGGFHAGAFPYPSRQPGSKRIEEIFGWVKVQGGQRQTRFRGRRRVEASFVLALAACNLARLRRLLAAAPP